MAKSRSKRTQAKRKRSQATRTASRARSAGPAVEPAIAPEAFAEVAPAAPIARPEPTVEAIRALAYSVYLERCGAPGRAVDDWLEAERRLRAD